MTIESILTELRSEDLFLFETDNTNPAAAPDNDDDDDDDSTDDWDPDSPFPFPTSGDKTAERTPDYARAENDPLIFDAAAQAEVDLSLERHGGHRPMCDDNTTSEPQPRDPETPLGPDHAEFDLLFV
ncbi:hypothetical protein [Roseobacter sp. A03A-229]